jgi:hypothetical protein
MLKKELIENVDYSIVNEKVMNIFLGVYNGTPLPRKFVMLTNGSYSLDTVFMRV